MREKICSTGSDDGEGYSAEVKLGSCVWKNGAARATRVHASETNGVLVGRGSLLNSADNLC